MEQQDPIDILWQAQKQSSKDIWNEWRKKADAPPNPDLSNFNQTAIHEDHLPEDMKAMLAFIDKPNGSISQDQPNTSWGQLNLQDYDLRGVIFINADLREADLRGANLEKAYLTGAELEGAHLSGANLNGADLRQAQLFRADLSHAQMQHATLSGADLRQAILSGADLSDARIQDADLSEAQLESSNLSRARLDRSRLYKAELSQAQLHATILREVNLEEAHLEGALGLSEEQLTGTNLKDVSLPSDVQKERIYLFDDKLNRIESAWLHLQPYFFVMLASCIYCWLTIASTTHAQLITDTVTSPLPIIGAKISIINFYRVAPFFLLILYIYFHQSLQRLWDMLASLPAVFPDGSRLDERSEPRHVGGFVRARLFILNETSSFRYFVHGAMFMILSWWSVPITLLVFWWNFLPRRDTWGDFVTIILIILITCTVTVGLLSYQRAVTTLQTQYQLPRKRSRLWSWIYGIGRKCSWVFILLLFGIIYYHKEIPNSFWMVIAVLIMLVLANIIMWFGIISFEDKLNRLIKYLFEDEPESKLQILMRNLQEHIAIFQEKIFQSLIFLGQYIVPSLLIMVISLGEIKLFGISLCRSRCKRLKNFLQECFINLLDKTFQNKMITIIDKMIRHIRIWIDAYISLVVFILFVYGFISFIVPDNPPMKIKSISICLFIIVLLTIFGSIKMSRRWHIEKLLSSHPKGLADDSGTMLESVNTRLIPVITCSLSVIFLMKINQTPTCWSDPQVVTWNIQGCWSDPQVVTWNIQDRQWV
ncbi:MAG: hypothetical protein ETSY1_02985 [Candidatus Entotheonella factor]|uniref:Pentapeptide repeat-containing protein n=1 Tax=Entotheonella factor TaxID=1429438 RepID=W4LWU8_ENTF1|nr:MAG: hypothetical protein ETSY1_02985 [Candidatus Entotheonella factor]